MLTPIKHLYIRTCGYSYPNLGRLFLRLFLGVMLLHFGIGQWSSFPQAAISFPSVLGLSPEAGLGLLIGIELVCALFIMFGFLTRLMTIPLIAAMVVAETYLLTSYIHLEPYLLTWHQPAYLPVMFLGLLIFLDIVGPGKISVDYFLSLHFIHTEEGDEEELEVV